jgi:hypothetical protein
MPKSERTMVVVGFVCNGIGPGFSFSSGFLISMIMNFRERERERRE